MNKQRVVYSTDQGRHCPECSKPTERCSCTQTKVNASGDGIVRLHRQSKGRAGKPVIVIDGLNLPAQELKKLAKRLKTKCGVGGSIEENRILIQGDKRDILKVELESHGYQVKIAGG